ncbi:1-acyl-sn-glycerol-3-phosphate acyltransferase [Diaphorobacter sp. HDW4A]|uniref:lysophospholipid acyltransferase family protein n=1 Tax=Diaphorobacter sp. HDW4A TaxID=2714924 RepID=UPI00140AFEB8|nr:lysophospholipid acyltransferase family protein [Diaphorobacter sp. HDW4A]QIL81881.1 1-acyl-sn-glycerol-3-phosphate acyltransferase [Diaphorobacter sp. HDW4A]
MAFIRSVLHLLWMSVTVIPYSLAMLVVRLFGGSQDTVYRIARAWLALSVHSACPLMGISYRVTGMENLPTDPKQGVVLLCKHQSTYETFLMPAIMPRQLAYVFKKELLKIPFFGWAIGSLDMVHIDRSQGSRAFAKVLQQGRKLLSQGTWVIMFPEGTRIPRGEVGQYKSGGARLAVSAGVPVVPIAVTSARVWPKTPFTKRPGIVDVSVGPQISSEGMNQDDLMQAAQDWIEAEMRRLDPDAYRPGK